MTTGADVHPRADATAQGVHYTGTQQASARLIQWFDPPRDYNFRHFRMRHMAAELLRTLRCDGVRPGRQAPDFDLESTRGDRVRLHELRGQPVLLHFVSYT